MPSNFALIQQFHEKFDPVGQGEALSNLLTRRVQYMFEEFKETAAAAEALLLAQDTDPATIKTAKAHLVKELADVLNVTYGFLNLLEVDADAAFAEVHRSNMSKTPNSGGKAIKGESYSPAEMEQFVDTSQKSRPQGVRVGVAAHVCRNGKVLAFERIGSLGKNTWTVLGGHLENGESWDQCAIRETLEEGGIATHSPELFAITNDVFPDGKHYVTLHVALKADTDAFTNAEPEKHQHLGWYSWNDIPQPRFQCIQSVYDQNLKPPYLESKHAA